MKDSFLRKAVYVTWSLRLLMHRGCAHTALVAILIVHLLQQVLLMR